MKNQVNVRRSSNADVDEGEFKAFVFGNKSLDGSEDPQDRVCPMDDMEWELKVRDAPLYV